jgi:hypothetical protein
VGGGERVFLSPHLWQLITAIRFDHSDTTRIGKYILNHSFIRLARFFSQMKPRLFVLGKHFVTSLMTEGRQPLIPAFAGMTLRFRRRLKRLSLDSRPRSDSSSFPHAPGGNPEVSSGTTVDCVHG